MVSILKTWLTCHPDDFAISGPLRPKLARIAESRSSNSIVSHHGGGGSNNSLYDGNPITVFICGCMLARLVQRACVCVCCGIYVRVCVNV